MIKPIVIGNSCNIDELAGKAMAGKAGRSLTNHRQFQLQYVVHLRQSRRFS